MSMGHVLLPLYQYPCVTSPCSNANAWTNAGIFSNITANPGMNFSVVVNPASGPGAKNSYPNSDYVAGIAMLNSFSNVQVLGYVDTGFTKISNTKVNQDVTTYHNWATYSSADIHVDGIFFDDCVSTYTSTAYSYYKGIASKTKTTMGPGFQHVLFNAGVGVDSRYFALADEIIIFEGYYSDWTDDTPYNTPQQYWPQSTVLIHHFTGDVSRQQQIIDNLIGNNFQGLYISTTGDYNNTDGVLNKLSNTGYAPGWDGTGNQINQGVYEYVSNLWTRFCYDMF